MLLQVLLLSNTSLAALASSSPILPWGVILQGAVNTAASTDPPVSIDLAGLVAAVHLADTGPGYAEGPGSPSHHHPVAYLAKVTISGLVKAPGECGAM